MKVSEHKLVMLAGMLTLARYDTESTNPWALASQVCEAIVSGEDTAALVERLKSKTKNINEYRFIAYHVECARDVTCQDLQRACDVDDSEIEMFKHLAALFNAMMADGNQHLRYTVADAFHGFPEAIYRCGGVKGRKGYYGIYFEKALLNLPEELAASLSKACQTWVLKDPQKL